MITAIYLPKLVDLLGDRLSDFEDRVNILAAPKSPSWNFVGNMIKDTLIELLPDVRKLGFFGTRYMKEAEEECIKLLQLDKLGMVGHPKSDKVYGLAWNYGHSSGYDEVFVYLQDLVELVKD